jgi:hypothetical protein
MSKRKHERGGVSSVLTRSGVFYPEEVNQQRVGPSHNNSTQRKGALLLQLRTVQCVDVEQLSSEESFMEPE